MDIEKELNRFINEQMMIYPTLNDWDIVNLKVGFAGGIKAAFANSAKELEDKLKAMV